MIFGKMESDRFEGHLTSDHDGILPILADGPVLMSEARVRQPVGQRTATLSGSELRDDQDLRSRARQVINQRANPFAPAMADVQCDDI